MECPICHNETNEMTAPECDACGRAICPQCATPGADSSTACRECAGK